MVALEVEAYSLAGAIPRTAVEAHRAAATVAAYRAALAIHTAAGAHSPAGAMLHMTGARAYSSAGEVYMPAVLPLHRPYARVALPGW